MKIKILNIKFNMTRRLLIIEKYVERIQDWKWYECVGIVTTNPTRPISLNLEFYRRRYEFSKIKTFIGKK